MRHNAMKESAIAKTGRLAPSPTGALHLGNIRTFMVAWLSARAAGGRVVLRIEDLDHPKVKPWAARQLLDDLRWLGFDWDEGPDVGGPNGPYIQSMRRDLYAASLRELRERGLVYPCICTRGELERIQSAPHAHETLHYDGRCRGRFASYAEAAAAADGRTPLWRFRVDGSTPVAFHDTFAGDFEQDVGEYSGDFAVARDSLGAGYTLAVAVDDAAMGVDEVVRGDDLLPATPAQILIQRALGLPAPRYCHVPLVVGPDGHRLAKRHGDTRVAAFRDAGIAPESVIGWLALTCGWAGPGERLSLRDALDRFDLAAIPHAPAVFDIAHPPFQ